jgi:glutamyl-Q tRNA(Asp) synthetase
MRRTRFAPSPTGFLHLGHGYSALTALARARAAGGVMLLRIEDIDFTRARPEYDAAILDDLRWLGLRWPLPVWRQSARRAAHARALGRLAALGLLYPCGCSRREIAAALSAPQEGAAAAPVYPGTCRGRPMAERRPGDAIRLDMGRALAALRAPPAWRETGLGAGLRRLDPARLRAETGDIVLARRDIGIAYHLAVVADDAAQGVTEVVRGADLAQATPIHVLLQTLLGLATPDYHHHRLIRGADGARLAKRDAARPLRDWRAGGATPADIRALLGLPPAP